MLVSLLTPITHALAQAAQQQDAVVQLQLMASKLLRREGASRQPRTSRGFRELEEEISWSST